MTDYLNALEMQGLLVRLLVNVGIGFLIGLEREYSKRVVEKEEQLFAGVRTFTLITLFGFLSALLAENYGGWILGAAFLGFFALLIVVYRISAQAGNIGGSTEMSSVLAFLLGAVVFEGHVLLAIIATVIVTSLLSFKLPLHRFVATMTMEEIRALIQFVVISAVMLPFLPDTAFGPYGVWNLRNIWTMVVLVSGISLAGYLLAKVLGGRKGDLLAGVLGGLVSSTAVTLDLSRRTKANSTHLLTAAVGITTACTIMFPRVLLECWLVNAELAKALTVPVAMGTVGGLLAAYIMHRLPDRGSSVEPDLSNPLNFSMALQFALVYMGVQWLVAFTMDRWGAQGTYVASLLSGATDMDAITLSMARMARGGDHEVAMHGILLAALSNTLFKYGIVLFVGGRGLLKYVGIGFLAMLLAALAGLFIVRG
ncbi:MAG: MgtC/SapB family protein [Flavobacteriales bacterium]|nr:MgtC/SapB family protein [Flavobacteriales bacterium]